MKQVSDTVEQTRFITSLYAVYWVDILHAIEYNSANLFQRLVGSHDTDSIALNQYIALREQLDGLCDL